MSKFHHTAALAALAAGAQLWSMNAAAHIELTLPLNRYSDAKAGDNKSCPCGSGTTNRSCSKPEERSDANRSTDRITTFAPGDTITVRWDEYVGHTGRFLIAFDPDGADLDDFNHNILLDVPDPAGNVGNAGDGSIWEFQVTLPDMTCDNCTLQLIQAMDNDTVTPILDPSDPSVTGGTYFQCADLVLAEGTPAGGIAPAAPTAHIGQDMGRNMPAGTTPATTAAASSASPASGGAASGGAATAGAAMAAAPSASAGGMALTGSSNSAMGSATTSSASSGGPDNDATSGGCSVGRAPRASGWSVFAGLAALLSFGARRKKRAA